MKRFSPLLAALLFALLASTARAETPAFVASAVEIPPDRAALFWQRFDGDTLLDMLVVDATRFSFRFLQPGGTYADAKRQEIEDPYGGALFDLADLNGDGAMEIVLLHAGGVDAYEFSAASGKIERRAEPLLGGMRGVAPQHLAPADFLFDVDNDGDEDIVYPLDGKSYIYFQDAGKFSKASQFSTRPVKIEMSLGEGKLRDKIESKMDIPRLAFQDVNGDGRLDLRASQGGDEIFYIQGPDGSIPEKPSYTLEISKLKQQAPKQEGPIKVDQFQFVPTDLNEDGVQDYVVVAGNKIWVFNSGKAGPDLAKPTQILKVSAEYMSVVLLPINDDKRPDLVILKYSVPSLGRIVAGLAIGLRFEVEFLGYNNLKEGGFSRTPDHRSLFVFRIPPIFRLLGELEGLSEQFKGIRKRARTAAGGDFDGDGNIDLVKAEKGSLDFYLTPKDESIKADFYEQYGDNKLFRDTLFGEKVREVTINTIMSFISDVVSQFQETAIQGRKPSFSAPMGEDIAKRSLKLASRDFNGDGLADLASFLGPKNEKEFEDDELQRLAIWMSQKR